MSGTGNAWETPDHIFEPLDEIFHFDCDVAASPENKRCVNYFDLTQSALGADAKWGRINWCNPPYGRGLFEPFVRMAIDQLKEGRRAVMLHKCDPSTKAFHLTWGKSHYFYYKRIKFVGAGNGATFPNCLTFFGHLSMYENQLMRELGQGEFVPW